MFGVMSSPESQRSALSALLKHSWTRRSVIMSDVMMRVDLEPVLWPGSHGAPGQRSEPVLWPGSHGAPGGRSEVRARPLARVTWGSGWEVRGQSPSSEVNVVYW
ncbi:unnamed protein product [Boreogadus saida]